VPCCFFSGMAASNCVLKADEPTCSTRALLARARASVGCCSFPHRKILQSGHTMLSTPAKEMASLTRDVGGCCHTFLCGNIATVWDRIWEGFVDISMGMASEGAFLSHSMSQTPAALDHNGRLDSHKSSTGVLNCSEGQSFITKFQTIENRTKCSLL